MKLVKGHGVYEKGKYKSTVNGEMTREYNLWWNMLGRAYDKDYHNEKPTYKEIVVCERWRNFQNFAEDINSMYGFNMVDDKGMYYQLDKDFINRGNKIYSKENCVFIPSALNSFITQLQRNKGKLPTGVAYNKRDKMYQAILYIDGKKYFKYFNNIHDCRMAYVISRNDYARELAEKYKGKVDQRVIHVLENYDEQDYTGAIEDLLNIA